MILSVASAHAMPKIEVVALFTGKAIVMIDGQRRLIEDGQVTPEGIQVRRINSARAILIIDGKEHFLTLNSRVGGPYARKQFEKVDVFALSNGQYVSAGSINGYPVQFMIDTGASDVAISEALARNIGINYMEKGRPVKVRTASHEWPAYAVIFDRVKIGGIELSYVDGIVIQGNKPEMPLLGMSFLGQLDVRTEGQMMQLRRQK
jgi:aspartyl protease family protein